MRVSAPWVLVQKCPLHKKNMNICGYMHVYIEVRSVSSREGTDICEFAHDGFVYKSFYDLKDVYLRAFTCKQRGSNCERLRGHRHM